MLWYREFIIVFYTWWPTLIIFGSFTIPNWLLSFPPTISILASKIPILPIWLPTKALFMAEQIIASVTFKSFGEINLIQGRRTSPWTRSHPVTSEKPHDARTVVTYNTDYYKTRVITFCMFSHKTKLRRSYFRKWNVFLLYKVSTKKTRVARSSKKYILLPCNHVHYSVYARDLSHRNHLKRFLAACYIYRTLDHHRRRKKALFFLLEAAAIIFRADKNVFEALMFS